MALEKIKEKLKGRNLRIFRFIIQLSSFLLFNLGFFIYIQYIFTGIILPVNASFGSQFTIIQGSWLIIERSISLAIFPFLAIGVLVLSSILLGKFTCGWICPFGFIQDTVSGVMSKIQPDKMKIKQETENTLRYGAIIIIFFSLTLAFFVGVYPLIRGSGYNINIGPFSLGLWSQLDPYNFLFSIIPQLIRDHVINVDYGIWNFMAENPLFIVQIIFSILVIFVFPYWISRVYCRFLCPTGACMGYIAKYGFLGLKRDPVHCKKCRKCEDACPMNVPILKLEFKRIRHNACVLCLECVAACPEDALKIAFS